jgi:hypothetical protein
MDGCVSILTGGRRLGQRWSAICDPRVVGRRSVPQVPASSLGGNLGPASVSAAPRLAPKTDVNLGHSASLGRESLYKTLSADAHPRFETINSVLHALGVKFVVVAERES